MLLSGLERQNGKFRIRQDDDLSADFNAEHIASSAVK